MEKRGASAIIFILMVIIIALVIIFIIYSFIKSYQVEKAQSSFNCVSNVDIELLNVCYQNNLLKIEIKNKKDIILGDFFLIKMEYNNGTAESIPTAPETRIMPYETKTISTIYKENLEKIKIIPRIENQAFLCSDLAPEVNEIKPCENEE